MNQPSNEDLQRRLLELQGRETQQRLQTRRAFAPVLFVIAGILFLVSLAFVIPAVAHLYAVWTGITK